MSISSRRRRVLAGLIAVVAGLLATALAFCQGVVPIKITAQVKVTPNKAGTPAHPQGVKVDVRAKIDIPYDYDPPLVQTVDVWFPRAGNFNGGKFPTCSGALMSRKGVGACPKGSIMGHGSAVADADGTKTYPTFTVVNGGATKVYFYVVLKVPARVQEPILATITKLPSGRWGYKAHAEIPRNLQIVAGIPLRVNSIHGTVGRGDWIATTSCPSSHRWVYHVETGYASGQVVKTDGSVPCRS
jgi:hypothetical protein